MKPANNPTLEERLNRIKRICTGKRAYSRRALSNRLGVSYPHATILVNMLLQEGVKLNLRDMYRRKGSREERERMIESGDYSLREMAGRFGVKWQAIYDYIIKQGMYKDWIKKRRKK